MTSALLDEARRHDAAMTEGPWYERGRFVSLTPVNTGMGATLHTNHIANLVEQDDAAGIAWLRTNLRALLDAHEQALGEVDRLRAGLTELRDAVTAADLPIVRCNVVVTEIDAILKGAP